MGPGGICVKCGLSPPQTEGCMVESADEKAALIQADAEVSKSTAGTSISMRISLVSN